MKTPTPPVSPLIAQRDKYARELSLLQKQKAGVERSIAAAEAKLEAANEIIAAMQEAPCNPPSPIG